MTTPAPPSPAAAPGASQRASAIASGPMPIFRYETLAQPVLPRHQFRRRMSLHFASAAAVVAASLLIGVAGYRSFAGMGWVDALLNASMILSGMGPVGELKTDAAKLFASGYALFSGIVFVITTGLLVTPIAHRMLHKLHADGTDR